MKEEDPVIITLDDAVTRANSLAKDHTWTVKHPLNQAGDDLVVIAVQLYAHDTEEQRLMLVIIQFLNDASVNEDESIVCALCNDKGEELYLFPMEWVCSEKAWTGGALLDTRQRYKVTFRKRTIPQPSRSSTVRHNSRMRRRR
jgi:hypothetical protein